MALIECIRLNLMQTEGSKYGLKENLFRWDLASSNNERQRSFFRDDHARHDGVELKCITCN